MKLHEYQAKQLFASAGIPVPRGDVVRTPAEAATAFQALARRCGSPAAFACSVKAQVHAGGRGKAGGVRTARSAEEASAHAQQMLGTRLVTAQTGREGLPVSAVLLEEGIAARQELYLAVTTPPALPRPPACTCALRLHANAEGEPQRCLSVSNAAAASADVRASSPLGVGMPADAKSCLA